MSAVSIYQDLFEALFSNIFRILSNRRKPSFPPIKNHQYMVDKICNAKTLSLFSTHERSKTSLRALQQLIDKKAMVNYTRNDTGSLLVTWSWSSVFSMHHLPLDKMERTEFLRLNPMRFYLVSVWAQLGTNRSKIKVTSAKRDLVFIFYVFSSLPRF